MSSPDTRHIKDDHDSGCLTRPAIVQASIARAAYVGRDYAANSAN